MEEKKRRRRKKKKEGDEEEKGGGGGARGKNELLPLTRRAHDRVLLRQKQSRCRRGASDGLVKSFLRERGARSLRTISFSSGTISFAVNELGS